jgi:hypothetical protein
MNLRLMISGMLVLCSLTLEGSEPKLSSAPEATAPKEAALQPWLEDLDFSSDQLDAEYSRAVGSDHAERSLRVLRASFLNPSAEEIAEAKMIPVVFQAAPDGEVLPPKAEAEAEPEPEALPVETPEEMRIKQLEMENAALKERLSRLEPYVDPDWPATDATPRKRRFRFARRPVQKTNAVQRVSRPTTSEYAFRYKPFTRAAMDTQMSGLLSRTEGQSLQQQRRFFWNATKALGEGVSSRQYRGIRLEVQRAMLVGEISPRYAVQYLADIVDIFRTYERMNAFGLTSGVAGPMSSDSYRRNPDLMFAWASEVNEHRRVLNRED